MAIPCELSPCWIVSFDSVPFEPSSCWTVSSALVQEAFHIFCDTSVDCLLRGGSPVKRLLFRCVPMYQDYLNLI